MRNVTVVRDSGGRQGTGPPLVGQPGVFPGECVETRHVLVLYELCVSLSKERALFLFMVRSFFPCVSLPQKELHVKDKGGSGLK